MKKNKKKMKENEDKKTHPILEPGTSLIAKGVSPPSPWPGGIGWYYAPVRGTEERETIKKEATEEGKKKTIKSDAGKIKKITLIEMSGGKHLIAINDNLNETKQIKNSEWWNIFIREIKERGMSNRTNVKDIPKSMVDYFNYNKEKCPIYMGGKYALTNIFIGRGIDTAINQEVKTKVMTERQYLTRKGRKK